MFQKIIKNETCCQTSLIAASSKGQHHNQISFSPLVFFCFQLFKPRTSEHVQPLVLFIRHRRKQRFIPLFSQAFSDRFHHFFCPAFFAEIGMDKKGSKPRLAIRRRPFEMKAESRRQAPVFPHEPFTVIHRISAHIAFQAISVKLFLRPIGARFDQLFKKGEIRRRERPAIHAANIRRKSPGELPDCRLRCCGFQEN